MAAGDRLTAEADEAGGGEGLSGREEAAGAEEACCCIAVGTADHSESQKKNKNRASSRLRVFPRRGFQDAAMNAK